VSEPRLNIPRLNVVGFSGNLQRPSKTRTLIETVIAQIVAQRGHDAVNAQVDTQVYDLVDVMPDLGLALGGPRLPDKLESVIERLATADAIVVGSPVYKGSYTGLFKHFFDLIEPQRLAGMPVVLAANGGGDRHALVVEHQLRPLFGFFSAHTIATSIYASERDFTDGRIASEALLKRIEMAVNDLAIWLDRKNSFNPSKLAS
jgi:FMN reductase